MKTENKIVASPGKIFRSLVTGMILGEELYLAVNDSASNYEEIMADFDKDIPDATDIL